MQELHEARKTALDMGVRTEEEAAALLHAMDSVFCYEGPSEGWFLITYNVGYDADAVEADWQKALTTL